LLLHTTQNEIKDFCASVTVLLLLTALYHFKVHDDFMERLRRSRFVLSHFFDIRYFD